MNAFGQQTGDETAGGLNHFASSRLKVGNVARHGALGVLLAHGAEVNPSRFPPYVFKVVEREGAVAVDGAALGQIEVEAWQGRDIGGRTGGQKQLYGFALGGDQQVELHTVEVASFAGGIAAVALLAIALRARNADIVTGREGKAVDEVYRTSIELFEDLSQHLEQVDHQPFDGMQSAVETALREHPGDVGGGGQQRSRPLQIPAKVQGGDKRDGHHLRVAHSTLRVFSRMPGLQHIIVHAIDNRDLTVHRDSPSFEIQFQENPLWTSSDCQYREVTSITH